MIKVCINGNILTMLRTMYHCAKIKIFNNGVMSDPCHCSLSVPQGEFLFLHSYFRYWCTSMMLKDVLMCLGWVWQLNIRNYQLYCKQTMLFLLSHMISFKRRLIYDLLTVRNGSWRTAYTIWKFVQKWNKLLTEEWKFGDLSHSNRNISYSG